MLYALCSMLAVYRIFHSITTENQGYNGNTNFMQKRRTTDSVRLGRIITPNEISFSYGSEIAGE